MALVLPGFILFLIMVLAPLVLGAFYSFTDFDGLRPKFEFTGLANYAQAFRDVRVRGSVGVTLIIAIAAGVVTQVLGIALALALNQPSRITTALRTIVVFPMILSGVIVGFLWKALLNTDGVINQALGLFGIERILFLGQPVASLFTVIFVIVWHGLGFTTIVMLAGLAQVPRDLLEAARIDGANRVQLFRSVVFPMIAPAFTITSLVLVISLLKEFEHVATITAGGPAGATRTLTLKLIQDSQEPAYAAAQAVLMMLFIFAVTVVLVRPLQKRERNIL
ncbi:MAG: sugar ABC transporter permease [Verrucomicrobia bacterium]|nr:sugar ABC transporter permease [Verrucomicrobiota bacterium]